MGYKPLGLTTERKQIHGQNREETGPFRRHHPARRAPVAVGDADAHQGHPGHLGGGGRRRLLRHRVLGRRDVRRLHALPARGSLGTSAPNQGRLQEDPPADAPARAELPGLQALSRRRAGALRGEDVRERHGHLPLLRRAQRRAQPRGRHQGRQEIRRARAGHHLLHRLAGAHRRQLRQVRQGASRPGHRLAGHQGHGRHPHPGGRARARRRAEEGPARPAHRGPLAHDQRHGPGHVHGRRRGRRGRRRLRPRSSSPSAPSRPTPTPRSWTCRCSSTTSPAA